MKKSTIRDIQNFWFKVANKNWSDLSGPWAIKVITLIIWGFLSFWVVWRLFFGFVNLSFSFYDTRLIIAWILFCVVPFIFIPRLFVQEDI